MIKTKRNILVATTAFFALSLMATACVSLRASYADSATDANLFEMVEGASVRLVSDSSGLRFRVKLGEEVKTSADKVGMYIFPYDYLDGAADLTDYDYTEQIETKIDLDLTEHLYEEGGYYYGNGVIVDIKAENITRKFVGVGYTVTDGVYAYTPIDAEKNSRSVADVATRAYVDEETVYTQTARDILVGYITADSSYEYAGIDTTYGGLGTEEYPYTISTDEQFAYFSAAVSAGNTYEGTYFRLTADVSASAVVGMTTARKAFAGVFDGNGNTVTADILAETTTCTGLFSWNTGTIRNLTVAGTVTSLKEYVGGIVGLNAGSIENCTNKATVTGTFSVGGITGYSTASVTDCVNEGAVSSNGSSTTVSSTSDGYWIGGIVGVMPNTGLIENSRNTGTITGNGGVPTGKTATSGYAGVGGIVGAYNVSTGRVGNCTNSGEVNANWYYGGIAGIAAGTIDGCTNSGKVNGGKNAQYGGGILGMNETNARIINSKNCGDVTGYSYVGGIVGNLFSAGSVVSGCTSENCLVYGQSRVGGIAGHVQTTANATIEYCTLTDVEIYRMSGSGYIGSVAGYMSTGTITGCKGNVSFTVVDNEASNVGNAVNTLYCPATSADAVALPDETADEADQNRVVTTVSVAS